MEKTKLLVFVSGNGTNLQEIIDEQIHSNYKIILVVSNRIKAFGLERAKNATEIIIATDPSVKGDTTALYISKILSIIKLFQLYINILLNTLFIKLSFIICSIIKLFNELF